MSAAGVWQVEAGRLLTILQCRVQSTPPHQESTKVGSLTEGDVSAPCRDSCRCPLAQPAHLQGRRDEVPVLPRRLPRALRPHSAPEDPQGREAIQVPALQLRLQTGTTLGPPGWRAGPGRGRRAEPASLLTAEGACSVHTASVRPGDLAGPAWPGMGTRGTSSKRRASRVGTSSGCGRSHERAKPEPRHGAG